MDRSREAHWQSAWARESLGAARRLPDREKFYALVAYPGSSGFLHIGHLRGLTYADAFHRFHRMAGDATFFPTGTHASGLPAVTFAQKVANRDSTVVAQLAERGVSGDDLLPLTDPAAAARFLGRSYLEDYRRLGLLLDERAYVTTIDADYQAFISWQFRRLADHGALVQAPHFASVCPVCGPVSVDPSETDLSSGGDAEWVDYQTVPFRLSDGRWLLAATLRPETLYGATNLWVHPTAPLVVWHHHDQLYLVQRAGAERLVEQHGGTIGHEVPVAELLGRPAQVPFSDRGVPVLASALVDPALGTGVVMSVPAHAPADWLALGALDAADRSRVGAPPVLIDLPPASELSASERALSDGEGVPAERAVRATGARSLSDVAAVDEATERLYRLELVRGKMRPEYAHGASVAEARERVGAELRDSHHAPNLQEFSIPVICRNGHSVVIRRIPDQWFIDYGNAAWKEKTRALVGRMRFFPEEYGSELSGILDWYADRPCVRRGRWLGTPFPLDPSWIVEPIADSTFYPAYFVVRPFVSSGRVPIEKLTDPFFDYVFLGRGEGERSLDRGLQEEIRADFTYWYPLDLNIGGKEHKRVHFPVFLYTHALLMPEELQPRAIFVNWWLTATGGAKVSKRQVSAKGGDIPPLQVAFDRWGADGLRLFYATSASPHQDIEWDPALVDHADERIRDVERLVRDLSGSGPGAPPELEAWLEAEVHDLVARFDAAFRANALRDAAEVAYVTMPARLRRYVLRGGGPGGVLERVIPAWIRMLVPITPHLAEELGEGRFGSLVSAQPLPRPDEFERSESALAAESYLERVEEDLRSVARIAMERGEPATAVSFFVAAPWKSEVEGWVRDAQAEGGRGDVPVRAIMDRAGQHAHLAAHRGSIAQYVTRVAPQIRTEVARRAGAFDEVRTLQEAEGYFARRFGLTSVQVFAEADAAAHDPKNRRERARPGRPAFYLSGHRSAGSTA